MAPSISHSLIWGLFTKLMAPHFVKQKLQCLHIVCFVQNPIKSAKAKHINLGLNCLINQRLEKESTKENGNSWNGGITFSHKLKRNPFSRGDCIYHRFFSEIRLANFYRFWINMYFCVLYGFLIAPKIFSIQHYASSSCNSTLGCNLCIFKVLLIFTHVNAICVFLRIFVTNVVRHGRDENSRQLVHFSSLRPFHLGWYSTCQFEICEANYRTAAITAKLSCP